MKPLFITPMEIWKRYARNLNEGFNNGQDLDYYFGSLTTHIIEKFDKDNIEIRCMNCKNDNIGVCEAHLGILNGIAEEHFHVSYDFIKQKKNNDCYISMTRKK